jgi:hypothetical protein
MQLQQIHEKVAAILDEAAFRGRVSHEATMALRNLLADWVAFKGGAPGLSLLHTAQGVIGTINSLGDADPYRATAFEDLRQLKLAWGQLFAQGG